MVLCLVEKGRADAYAAQRDRETASVWLDGGSEEGMGRGMVCACERG